MLRLIYLVAMGSFVGAIAGVACGHAPLWISIGIGLGLLWRRAAPNETDADPGKLGAPRRRWPLFFVMPRRRFAIETCVVPSDANPASLGIAMQQPG